MKPATTQRCSNCAFWLPPANPKPAGEGGTSFLGLCRRYPPVPVWTNIRVNSVTASSFDSDWCGEWRTAGGG
jgi:hypothetical protein